MTIGDEPKVVSFSNGGQEAGQPSTPADQEPVPPASQSGEGQEPGQQEGTEPTYITTQELDERLGKGLDERLSSFEDTVARQIQSLSDKAESRITKQVKDQLGQLDTQYQELKAAGIPVTDEMLQNAKAKVVHESLSAQGVLAAAAAAEGGDGKEAVPSGDPINEFINARTQQLYQEYGLVIEQSDEESKAIDQSDPWKFLNTLEVQLQAKKERVGDVPENVANPAATMPALGTGGGIANPISNITDPDELLKMAVNKRRGR